jgi:predicted nuclease with RNAse H fold
MVVLGFDPGGIGQFGWCVAEAAREGRIKIRKSGIANSAAEAYGCSLEWVSDKTEIAAVGIDSPLFWVASGDREVDRTIRKAMADVGAVNVYGTVQQVNSLRGACLAQGIMTAHLLRRDVSNVRLTESHPKALLWLLEIASQRRRVLDVTLEHLADFVEDERYSLSEHERDAALGAVGAFAMLRGASGWRDLAPDEEEPFVPVAPVEYWMPIPKYAA